MWLKSIAYCQLLVAFLLFHYNVMPTSAANMAQLKNQQQQQPLGQNSATSTQHQPHPHHVRSQTQNQLQQQQQQQQQHHLHQQPLQSSGIVASHPTNGMGSNANSILHGSDAGNLDTETQTQTMPSSYSSLSSSTSSSLAHLPAAQYVVQDKEAAMQEVLKHFNADDDFNDPYQILNELKRETHVNTNDGPPTVPALVPSGPTSPASPSSFNSMTYPWNFYDRPYASSAMPLSPMAGFFSHMLNQFEAFSAPFPVTPRFMPVMSFPQPVYVPYPLIMSPNMFYPGYSNLPHLAANNYEDSMSRVAGSSRRPGSSQHSSSYSRNSPIYYVRLPPTPYMFMPSLGLGASTTPMAGYPTVLPYQSLPSFSSFSSIFNVPINFLANGKPTNIYQMGAPPNDIQNPLQFANIPSSFNTRPPPPPPPNAYRPAASSHNYFNAQPSTAISSQSYASYPGSSSSGALLPPTSSSTSSSSSQHQDSKLTALKRPYYFNGRPEDIYVLPNNLNPLYSSESSYY